jgi:hypothetical protein
MLLYVTNVPPESVFPKQVIYQQVAIPMFTLLWRTFIDFYNIRTNVLYGRPSVLSKKVLLEIKLIKFIGIIVLTSE